MLSEKKTFLYIFTMCTNTLYSILHKYSNKNQMILYAFKINMLEKQGQYLLTSR